MKIKIGKNAYLKKRHKDIDDYINMTGTIELCRKCCKQNRIQFDNVGNNEALSNFDILKCKLY